MKYAVEILLAAALAARLLLVFFTAFDDSAGPIPSFNDEPAHMNYVRFLADWGRLPVQTSSVQDGLTGGEFEYYQPPLYYLLVRPFYSLSKKITPGGELYWARCVSLAFSMAGLLVLFMTVRGLFTDRRPALEILLLGALGGIPLRFGALATNDSLFFALCCFYFALILEILKSGCDVRLLVAGILTTAAGLWTKASFLLLLPLFPWALLRGANRSIIKVLAAAIIPVLAILPWYLRNQALYDRWMPISVGFGTPEPLTLDNIGARGYLLVNYFARSLVFPYDQLWGGWLDVVIYPLEGLIFLILLFVGLQTLRTWHRQGFRIFAGIIALNVAGYLWINSSYSQAEARHFMPALPFMMTLLALGADQIAGKKKSRAFVLLGLWIILPWLTVFS